MIVIDIKAFHVMENNIIWLLAVIIITAKKVKMKKEKSKKPYDMHRLI